MQNFLDLVRIKEDIPSIFPYELFHIGFFTFTSSTLTAILGVFLFLFLAYKVKSFKLVPGRFQHIIEMLVETLYNFIKSIVSDDKKAKEIFPYVGAIFMFILFANLIGIIPGLSSLKLHDHHMFTASTADFNTTFALALASIVILNITGIFKNGLFNHLGHYIQIKPIITGFKKSFGEGMLGIIQFFVGLIEIIGEVAKIVSLSLRLFGNMFAHGRQF